MFFYKKKLERFSFICHCALESQNAHGGLLFSPFEMVYLNHTDHITRPK